ncbi:SAM-dependent methyltransferase [Bradyrhizobium sp. CCBAU 051011]|uniref:SAM-dependent methyltransferase n=1 Tax=Bradyrhizobium sp. CCBAU 051011 TaxID=858422 RepID=UPI0013795F08|nr:SAM-dependent methyltransferase [Bradyrhizobium sp. CCBAU 051011]
MSTDAASLRSHRQSRFSLCCCARATALCIGAPIMSAPPKLGILAIIGTGIQGGRQLTREAITRIKSADVIMFCVSEPLTRDWLLELRPDAEDLSRFYADGKDRRTTYEEMVESMLEPVRQGKSVAAAFYGHPGVFVSPSHEAVKRARREGYRAFMQPAISAEACLYADLGIDPAEHGCLSFEASEWLVFGHRLDPSCAVILWQVDCVGEASYQSEGYNVAHVPLLIESLLRYYDADHIGYLYHAPVLPIGRSKVWPVKIRELHETLRRYRTAGTLFIPPAAEPPVDLDMARRLGISADELERDIHMPPWGVDPRFQVVMGNTAEPEPHP